MEGLTFQYLEEMQVNETATIVDKSMKGYVQLGSIKYISYLTTKDTSSELK